MKNTTLTEKKAEETPTGGVLVGKRKGQTIIHNKGTLSGYLVGKTHAEGGIKAVNKSTGQPLEMQGGEVVITAPAVSDQTKNEFNGKMLTNREILSQINVNGGGVAFAKDGMEIPKSLKHTGATYSYGGKTMTDHEIYKHITGGHLAKGKTLSQIAKMHNVTLKQLQSQVNMGMKAESEHTSSKREQMKIVKDHLYENPKYYSLLKKAGLKKGGSLVRDAKSGNTPARDLNNYNDVLDVDADGKVGGDDGIDMDGTGGADASSGIGAFEEGGDLDFLNDVDRVFDEGGSTDLPIISYVIIRQTGTSLSNLGGKRYDSYNEFTEGVEQAYKEIGKKVRSWLSFDFYDENGKLLINTVSYISDQKNTVKNFNPFTGNSNNLKKVFQTAYPRSYFKYNWDEWFAFKKSSSTKTEPKKESPAPKSTSGGGSRQFSSGEIDMFNQIDGILQEEDIDIDNVLTVAYHKIDSTKDFDIVNTLTGDVFLLRVFEDYLGVAEEDENRSNSKELLKDFKEWRKSNPTSASEIKQISYVEVAYSVGGGAKKEFTALDYDDLIYVLKNALDLGAYMVDVKIFAKGESGLAGRYGLGVTRNPKLSYDINPYTITKEEFRKEVFEPFENKGFSADEFFGSTSKTKEEPKQEEQPIRNFELEKKYLTQRINTLSSELDLKRPILSNDEVAFYQREINKFVSKLRKVSNDEMELKPLQARINGVYKVKWGDYDKQYPKSDLKSINGIDSELTFEEYMTVRTPEFMSFFGNWEQAYLDNTYSGVSKIINPKTKEPMPVFHGTNVLFTEWKTYETNNAHYFAVKREMSDFFASSWESRTDKAGVDSKAIKALNPNTGKFLYRCFLDIRNPIDFSKFGVEKRPIKEFLLFLKINYNIGDYDFWTNLGNAKGFTSETKVYAWQIIRLWQNFTKYVKTFTTYDGYIFYEYIPDTPFGGLDNASLSFCAFESNQIKFADAYEFNALSNDSRFDFGGKL